MLQVAQHVSPVQISINIHDLYMSTSISRKALDSAVRDLLQIAEGASHLSSHLFTWIYMIHTLI